MHDPFRYPMHDPFRYPMHDPFRYPMHDPFRYPLHGVLFFIQIPHLHQFQLIVRYTGGAGSRVRIPYR